MDNLSQTKTEAKQGGKTKYTRKQILQAQLGCIEYEKHRAETQAKIGEFLSTYGRNPERSSFYRQEGLKTRLSAMPIDLAKCENEQD